jgi:hypothetical protein
MLVESIESELGMTDSQREKLTENASSKYTFKR